MNLLLIEKAINDAEQAIKELKEAQKLQYSREFKVRISLANLFLEQAIESLEYLQSGNS